MTTLLLIYNKYRYFRLKITSLIFRGRHLTKALALTNEGVQRWVNLIALSQTFLDLCNENLGRQK